MFPCSNRVNEETWQSPSQIFRYYKKISETNTSEHDILTSKTKISSCDSFWSQNFMYLREEQPPVLLPAAVLAQNITLFVHHPLLIIHSSLLLVAQHRVQLPQGLQHDMNIQNTNEDHKSKGMKKKKKTLKKGQGEVTENCSFTNCGVGITGHNRIFVMAIKEDVLWWQQQTNISARQ